MSVNATNFHSRTHLNIVQINLGRSRAASEQLLRLSQQRNWDVLLIQEPCIYGGRVTNLGSSRVCFHGTNTRAAIAVTNPSLSLFYHQNISHRDFAIATIGTDRDKFTFGSAYHEGKPRHDHRNNEDIERIERLIDNLPNDKIHIGMDANAYSPAWSSEQEDNRGRDLLEFLTVKELFIANNSNIPTYAHQADIGFSNIDITVSNRSAVPTLENWNVSTETSMSDHRYITFNVRLTSAPINQRTHSRRFCLSRADWPNFNAKIQQFKPVLSQAVITSDSPQSIEAATQLYMKKIGQIARQSIPYSRPSNNGVGWWSPDLTNQRHNVNRLRRKMKRNRNHYEEKRQEYLQAFHRYKTSILEHKTQWFRSLCSIDSDKDPWGSIYKMLRTKKQLSAPLKPIRKPNGTFTDNEEDTASFLLERFFPEDNINQDNIDTSPPDTNDDLHFSEEEVKKVIFNMKTKKSPGFDLITAPILRQVTLLLLPEITALFNKCLDIGYFPTPFKQALIKFIPKPNYDSIDTHKAFRPICLLPTIGKALDSLMIKRIQWHLYTNNLMSRQQYGFVPQTSTTDAILNAIQIATEYRHKQWCVLLISLDIEGAFDSAKWPNILAALKNKNCPQNIYKLAKSYLSDRHVTVETESVKINRNATQGCMQGSPSGPVFWNTLYDGLLNIEFPEHVFAQAYADDALIIACGASIKCCSERANKALRLIGDWATTVHLNFNASKSQILQVGKGSEIPEKPDILLNGQKIKFYKEIRYLGITIDRQFLFATHIRTVCNKAIQAVSRFATVCQSTWGLNARTMGTIWNCALLPAITYGAPVWASKVPIEYNTRRLKTVQRLCMLRIARAYRTTSHEALWTITGNLPITLHIEQIASNYWINKGLQPFTNIYRPVFLANIDFNRLEHRPKFFSLQHPAQRTSTTAQQEHSTTTDIITIRSAKNIVKIAAEHQWQQMWDSSEKGRITHRFMPSIAERLKLQHLHPCSPITQVLTGHGNFMQYLHRFKIKDSPYCTTCNTVDDVPHRLFSCQRFTAERQAFSLVLGSAPTTIENLKDIFTTKITACAFGALTKAITAEDTSAQQTFADPNHEVSVRLSTSSARLELLGQHGSPAHSATTMSGLNTNSQAPAHRATTMSGLNPNSPRLNTD